MNEDQRVLTEGEAEAKKEKARQKTRDWLKVPGNALKKAEKAKAKYHDPKDTTYRDSALSRSKMRRADPEIKESLKEYEKEYGKAYRAVPENREAIRVYGRERYKRPEVKERAKELAATPLYKQKVKNRKNDPNFPLRQKAYKDKPENKLRAKLLKKAWRLANPELSKLYSSKREERFRAGGPVAKETVFRVFNTTSCEYCGCLLFAEDGPAQRQMEHVVPLIRGGTNHDSNFAASCRTCNYSKGVKLLNYEWFSPKTEEKTYTSEEIEAYRILEVQRQQDAMTEQAAMPKPKRKGSK